MAKQEESKSWCEKYMIGDEGVGPTVSVIIPTQNRACVLKNAIESVLIQSYKDFELIIISDGSTDDTEKLVNSYKDSRIIFLKHETSRGASAARNTGLKVARGKYIAFLDDDDEWVPNKLEIQMPVIEKSPPEVGLVYAWMEYFKSDKSISVRAPTIKGYVFQEMLDKQAIGGCPTVIIKREVIDEVGFFDESLLRGNDGDYLRRISKHYHVDFVPKILAKINIGLEDRISNDSTAEGLKKHIKSAEIRIKKFREDFDIYPEAESKILFEIIKAYLKLKQPRKVISLLLRIISILNVNIPRWYKFAQKFKKG